MNVSRCLVATSVTSQNCFEVVHGFSHQNGKAYSILNHCELATLASIIQHHFYHLNISSFKNYKKHTTQVTIHHMLWKHDKLYHVLAI
jgi:hypothetical protein